jgi:hypothetical protein
MRPTTRSVLAAMSLPLLLACDGRHPKAPIHTSLGTLVAIEQRESIETLYRSRITLTAESAEILYVLTFDSVSAITYEGKIQNDGPSRLLLVDSTGARFSPVFWGTAKSDGVISMESWRFSGKLVFPAGTPAPVFQGTATLSEPRLTLIYRVPRNARGLALLDGDQRYPLD